MRIIAYHKAWYRMETPCPNTLATILPNQSRKSRLVNVSAFYGKPILARLIGLLVSLRQACLAPPVLMCHPENGSLDLLLLRSAR